MNVKYSEIDSQVASSKVYIFHLLFELFFSENFNLVKFLHSGMRLSSGKMIQLTFLYLYYNPPI